MVGAGAFMIRDLIQLVRRRTVWRWGLLLLLLLPPVGLVWLFWDAKEPHPVSTLPLQGKVIRQVAADSPDQLLDQLLTKLDDFAQAVMAANLHLDVALCSESYGRGQGIAPNMMRVRRIVEECRNGQPVPLAKLRAMLATSVDGYQEVYERVEMLQGVRGKQQLTGPFPEFDEWTRKGVYAKVAVYLLGEFDDFASLPKLAEIWEIKKLLPVSRLFVLAVMADLARRHPRETLSPEAVAALEAFLAQGGKVIVAPVATELTAWNAPVTETDFRIKVQGKDVGLDRVRKVQLRIYSPQLQEYEKLSGAMGAPPYGLKPEVFAWFRQMKVFVNLAYRAPTVRGYSF
jgi:hypothetical protein